MNVRLMYDSVDASAIPRTAQLVAGYIDGNLYRWTAADWARFPNARKVRIARRTSTNDGHVLDVEYGIPTVWPLTDPVVRQGIVRWVKMRRAAGIEPTIYCNQLNDWLPLQRIFHNALVKPPQWWVARYNNRRDIPTGAIGKQFANPPLSGGHYDLSVVADYWPGVDPTKPIPEKETDDMTREEHDMLVKLTTDVAQLKTRVDDLWTDYRVGETGKWTAGPIAQYIGETVRGVRELLKRTGNQ